MHPGRVLSGAPAADYLACPVTDRPCLRSPGREDRPGIPPGRRHSVGSEPRCTPWWPRRTTTCSGHAPCTAAPRRLARAQRRLARRPRGRDPRRRRPARQRQDHPAALPVRAAASPSRARSGSTASPVHTMGRAARERLRRDRFGWIDPEPRSRPRAHRLGERRPAAAAARHLPPRAPRRAALEWLERLDIGDCARKRPHAPHPVRAPAGRHRPRPGPAPSVLFADEPTAPLHRADRAHVLRTLTTAARSHGITVRPRHPRRGHRGARRPHGLPARRTAGEHRAPAPGVRPESEGRAACSLSV